MRRLLLISGVFPVKQNPSRGIFVAEQAQLLQTRGMEIRVVNPLPHLFPLVHLLRPQLKGAFRASSIDESGETKIFRPRYWKLPWGFGVRKTEKSLHNQCESVVSWLGGWKPDIIHVHGIHPFAAMGDKLANHFSAKMVATVHGWDFDKGLEENSRSYILDAVGKLDALVVVNQTHVDVAVSSGISNELIHLIPCHVEVDECWLEHIRHIDLDSRHLRLLFGANPRRPEKGSRLFKRTVRKLHERGWDLEIDYLGGLSKEECCNRMSKADILVLSSKREGSAQVLKEAVACGTRVVSTNVGDARTWLPEISIANQRNPTVLAETIEAAAALDSEKWNIPSHFTATEVAAKLESMYESTYSRR